MASPSQAADVGLFMQWRSLNFMVLEDEELQSDQSSQSDQATSLLPGVVVGNATAELMEMPVFPDCSLLNVVFSCSNPFEKLAFSEGTSL